MNPSESVRIKLNRQVVTTKIVVVVVVVVIQQKAKKKKRSPIKVKDDSTDSESDDATKTMSAE